jgi:mono/diheme cytochrome c family protein
MPVGATGDSPNEKAPQLRSLPARHLRLAPREPLSHRRTHDEMPRFALTAPEIDRVVAYINTWQRPRWAGDH